MKQKSLLCFQVEVDYYFNKTNKNKYENFQLILIYLRRKLTPRRFVKNVCFVNFSIIFLKCIFSEIFTEFSQVVQKIWKKFCVNISYFHQFSSTFSIFLHYRITKKLMTTDYNRWCQIDSPQEKLPSRRPALLGLIASTKKNFNITEEQIAYSFLF